MENTDLFKQVLKMEAQAILASIEKINQNQIEQLLKVFDSLIKMNRSLIFCGVGKSGQIGLKLSSTFSSLGLSSFFLHPVEALHGDLGRVTADDAIVFISKSGTTEEIIKLLPFLPNAFENRIALTGNVNSVIANKCLLIFDCSVEKEACLNNQAPTTSSTLCMAIGDAMAVLYEKVIGISVEKFAVNHPGGLLGKSLLMKVQDLMWHTNECPKVFPEDNLQEIILEMTKYNLGGCAILSRDGDFLGIIVEGDIRRTFAKSNNGLGFMAKEIMNKNPISIGPSERAFEALALMENRESQIGILPVVDNQKKFLGFIRLHDLLKEGFISV